jgi:SPP1 family phage portal protein
MQTLADIKKVIEQGALDATSKMIADLVSNHRAVEGKRLMDGYNRYIQSPSNTPILLKQQKNPYKVWTKIPNDFYGDIVDTKTGYMGNAIVVDLSKEEYKTETTDEDGKTKTDVSTGWDDDNAKLTDFSIATNQEDANSELLRMAVSTGLGCRLLYIPSGEAAPDVRSKNINPWECIFLYDESVYEPTYVLRYYTLEEVLYDVEGTIETDEVTVVEWYDKENVTYYVDDANLKFHLDTTKGTNGVQPHFFNGIPVLAFPNNEMKFAEPSKVVNLIDAYDNILSATTSEVEQLRLAYMFAKGSGMKLDDAFYQRLEQTGVFPLPVDGEIGFTVKQLDLASVKELLAELRRNIYQFAKSLDMSRDMGGDIRVIGWQVALLNLENSCKITERKFTRALREQYRMLCEFWKTYKNVDINYLDLQFIFTRNFPRDIESEARTLTELVANISRKTAYGLMSFIEDPDAEMKAWEEQEEANRPDIDLEQVAMDMKRTQQSVPTEDEDGGKRPVE